MSMVILNQLLLQVVWQVLKVSFHIDIEAVQDVLTRELPNKIRINNQIDGLQNDSDNADLTDNCSKKMKT